MFKFIGIAAAPRLAGGGDTGLACRQRGRGKLGDALGDFSRAGLQARSRRRPLHQAELKRGRAVEDFGAENKPRGNGASAQPGQALGAAGAGQQAEPDFRQAELGLVRGDAQIAGEGELKSAAQRRPPDLRQCHLRQLLDAEVEVLNGGYISVIALRPVVRFQMRANIVEVRPRAEHFLVRADMQQLAVGSVCQFIEFVSELHEPLAADRIGGRPAERQRGDAVGEGQM
jgi:hypothetical protein